MPSAVELRVVDRGPDIPAGERDRVFVPFQRLGETDNTIGVGLGLALSRGLTEVIDGTLEPEETPGGGLTMIISLPAAPQDGLPTGAAPALHERNGTGSGPGPPVTRYGPGIATSRSGPGGGS
jgi:two-component system sensor histidine kinase KdpD